MNSNVTMIIQTVMAVGLLVLATVLLSYKPLVTEYLELKAKHDCASDYRLEYADEENNTKVYTPIEDKYQKCLLDSQLR